MSKGNGGTKGSTWRNGDHAPQWSRKDDFDSILRDSISIFKYEAKKGLGNYEKQKPREVSSSVYENLLASGNYIEVRHGGFKKDIEQLLHGSYYHPVDIHIYGPGYYFRGSDKGSSYAHGPESGVLVGLIKKSDTIGVSSLQSSIEKGTAKYLGNGITKDGKKISSFDSKDIYARSTAAARRGYKVLKTENKYNDFVIIDRSALIVKKK